MPKIGSWQCPFCNHWSTLGYSDTEKSELWWEEENSEGPRYARTTFTVCPNPACKKTSFTVALLGWEPGQDTKHVKPSLVKLWRLVPESSAKVFPDYIPKQIRDDYTEACLIVDKSAKASAALARRCLQGMIRDFWKVKEKRLVDAIEAIETKVAPLTWKAIDAMRSIGNIGAHMEKDVNLIIDVEPEEASELIKLIGRKSR